MKVGEGVYPPLGIHYAWTSDHLILFRFDMVWPKKTMKVVEGVYPPLGILMKEGYYGKKCEYGWAMHFRSWCLFCSTGDLSCMDLGYCWFLGHTGSLWKAASLVPGKAKATRRGLMGFASFCNHIVIFCSFFWRRDRRGVAVWCCDMTLGIYRNDLESNPIHVQAGWNLYKLVDYFSFMLIQWV